MLSPLLPYRDDCCGGDDGNSGVGDCGETGLWGVNIVILVEITKFNFDTYKLTKAIKAILFGKGVVEIDKR